MTVFTPAALAALAFAFGAAFVLLPLAKAIPAHLEKQWVKELEAHSLVPRYAPDPKTRSYSLSEKVPIVITAMVLGFIVITVHGSTAAGAAYSLYYFNLLLLVVINANHTLLPDTIVLPTLWAGLLFHMSTGGGTDPIYGAAVGYLAPFAIACAIKAATGKEVIGRGDLKALAMAGAWLGLGALPVIFGAFVLGFILWSIIHLAGRKLQGFVPTGPAHLFASLAVTLGVSVF